MERTIFNISYTADGSPQVSDVYCDYKEKDLFSSFLMSRFATNLVLRTSKNSGLILPMLPFGGSNVKDVSRLRGYGSKAYVIKDDDVSSDKKAKKVGGIVHRIGLLGELEDMPDKVIQPFIGKYYNDKHRTSRVELVNGEFSKAIDIVDYFPKSILRRFSKPDYRNCPREDSLKDSCEKLYWQLKGFVHNQDEDSIVDNVLSLWENRYENGVMNIENREIHAKQIREMKKLKELEEEQCHYSDRI